MGATPRQTVFYASAARGDDRRAISAVVVTTIALIVIRPWGSYVGGGGLGDIAIGYGYQRYQIEDAYYGGDFGGDGTTHTDVRRPLASRLNRK